MSVHAQGDLMSHLIEAATNSEFGKGERFLRLPAVMDRIPYSRPTIYRLMAAGKFPKAIQLSAGAVAWRERDIDLWCQARILGE